MKHPFLRFAAWMSRLVPAPVRSAVYRLGPLTRLLRRLLNRAAPHGLTEVTVAAGPLAGVRLALDLQTEKDYWLGTYEPAVLAELDRLVTAGMVAYDVGANIGYVTLAIARRVGASGKVFAFEALPENLSRLERHITLNNLQTVSVVAKAVVDRPGEIPFLIGPSGGMGKAAGSDGRTDLYQDSLMVEAISLDHFVFTLKQAPPDFVKLDIEGGEGMALAGMQQLLAQARPTLLLEVHGPDSARSCWAALSAAGYQISALGQPGIPFSAPDQLPWKSYLQARPAEIG